MNAKKFIGELLTAAPMDKELSDCAVNFIICLKLCINDNAEINEGQQKFATDIFFSEVRSAIVKNNISVPYSSVMSLATWINSCR